MERNDLRRVSPVPWTLIVLLGILLAGLVLACVFSPGDTAPPADTEAAATPEPTPEPAARLLAEMTLREKICQLLVVQPQALTGAKTVTVVMYYSAILPGRQSATAPADSQITVFTGVNIPEALDRAQAAAFNADGEAGFTIDVVADAVQTENLGTNAYDAFQALAAATAP